jgi:preprotein translocase subunit SecG
VSGSLSGSSAESIFGAEAKTTAQESKTAQRDFAFLNILFILQHLFLTFLKQTFLKNQNYNILPLRPRKNEKSI